MTYTSFNLFLQSAVKQLLFFLSISTVLVSCTSTRIVSYLPLGIDTASFKAFHGVEQKIKVGERLQILIYSDNQEATAIFNQAGINNSSSFSGSRITSNQGSNLPTYLVETDGTIKIHQIGQIKVEGYSRTEVKAILTAKLNELNVLLNPYCEVFSSAKRITILGELKNPGTILLEKENPTVFDALGQVGDVTDYAKKDEIKVIREFDGSRQLFNIDLTSPNLYSNKGFYLQNNDLILVNPIKNKPTTLNQRNLQYVSIGVSFLTTIGVIINLTR